MEVGVRAARALDARASSGLARSVPRESTPRGDAPETRGVGTGSSAAHDSARLYAPPSMRQNVNATTANALVAATLAASAPAPEPYPVYAMDEDGNELLDDPPVRRVPMRRRLTVPRGLLGAYDIVTRMDEPEDPATDAEDELSDDGAESGQKRADRAEAPNGGAAKKSSKIVFDLRSAAATKDAVLRHARATCPGGHAAAPLTRDLYPGDAERDAAVLLARATNDGKTQTVRLRDREKKLGLGKAAEKKRKRGGPIGTYGTHGGGRRFCGSSGRGRGRGSGRGSSGRGGFVSETTSAANAKRAFSSSRSETEYLSAEDAMTDEDERS